MQEATRSICPPIFTSVAPVLLEQSNKTSFVFPALKSTSHYLPQSTQSTNQSQVQKSNLVVAKQMTDFYMKRNSGLKCVNPFCSNFAIYSDSFWYNTAFEY